MKLHELNRAEKWAQENPDRLKSWGLEPKEKKEPDGQFKAWDYEASDVVKQAVQKFEAKWGKRVPGIILVQGKYWGADAPISNPFADTDPGDLFGWRPGSNRIPIWKNWDVSHYIEDFVRWGDRQSWQIDGEKEQLIKRAGWDDNPKLAQFVESDWFDEWINDVKGVYKKFKHIYRSDRGIKKQAAARGINPVDYEAGLQEIERFTTKSYRNIQKKWWPLLQAMTVDANDLPKVIYRGMFYDGKDIKDREEFMKKWHPGSKPKLRQKKASSWSADPATAVHFMDSQDHVKDSEGGFHILMKYEITDPSLVIADLRKVPAHGFYNQMEIVLNPMAKEYEVVKIFPYQKNVKYDKQKLRDVEKEYPATMMSGGYGREEAEFISARDSFRS